MAIFLFSLITVSLVTSVLAVGLSFVFNSLKGRISPRVKYFLWIGLLASFLLPFRPQFGDGLVKVSHEQLFVPQKDTVVAAASTTIPSQSTSLVDQVLSVPWVPMLLGVWFLGAMVMLGRQLYATFRFHQLLRRWGEPLVEKEVWERFERLKQSMGIQQNFQVVYYQLAHSPMLVGLRKPTIILPEMDFSEEELDLIFEHELTHYKHRDLYVNLLLLFVSVFYWFNPFVQFASKETQEAGEIYCDCEVLARQDKTYRTFYGETIISMIGRNRQQPTALSSCFYSAKFNLKRRMEAIVHAGPSTKGLTTLAVLIVGLSLVFSGSVFALVENTPQLAETIAKVNPLTIDQLKERIATKLQVSVSDIGNWILIENDQFYEVSFTVGDSNYQCRLLKSSGRIVQLSQVSVQTPQTVSEAPDSSTRDQARSTSSSSASSGMSASTTVTSSSVQAPTSSTPNTAAADDGDDTDDLDDQPDDADDNPVDEDTDRDLPDEDDSDDSDQSSDDRDD